MTDRIGKYEVRGEIGHGGFGHVYVARDPLVNRLVAIKVLISAEDREVLGRFRAEAAAAGRLHHKNIVTIYDYGEQDGLPYLVMEYLEGRTIQQILQTSGARELSLLEKLDVMSQAAEGLHCAHQNGIVHRDVKPSNIMVLRDGSVKILDFGIARVVHSDTTRRTRTGFLIGTLAYMCPEQFLGEQVDARADIWAYGVIFYELLGGVHPFQANDPASLMYRINNVEPAAISALAPDCPEALAAVLRRALMKDRELRYHSLQELLYDTEPILLELKRERAGRMVSEAQKLLERGEVEGANGMVRSILALDATNREARQLREAIQQELQRRTVKPKVEALLKSAEDSLAQRQFPEAIQTLESALRLDSGDLSIRSLLDQAQANYRQSQRASQLVAEARQRLAKEDFTAAQSIIAEALRADSQNPQAAQLLEAIDHGIEQRERELERAREIERTVQRARTLLSSGDFERASELLAAGLLAFPGDEGLVTLMKEAVNAKAERIRAVQRVVRRAESLREEGLIAEAMEVLNSALRENGDLPEFSDLHSRLVCELEEQQRSRMVGDAKARAYELWKAGRPAEAMALLSDTAGAVPGAGQELAPLMAEVAEAHGLQLREEWIGERLKEAATLETGGQLADALALLEALDREHPQSKHAATALRVLRARIAEARERRLRDLLAGIEQKLDAGDWEAALPLTSAAQSEFPGEAGFQRLMARAEAQVAEAKAKAKAAEFPAVATVPLPAAVPPETWEFRPEGERSQVSTRAVAAGVVGLALVAGWWALHRDKASDRPPSAISVSERPLAFRFQMGSAAHPSAGLVISGEAGARFQVRSEALWLTLQPAGGTAPQTVKAGIDPWGLHVGKYTGTIVVEGIDSTTPVHHIPVTLEVTGEVSGEKGGDGKEVKPEIAINPKSLSFSVRSTEPETASLSLAGSVPEMPFSASVASGQEWLSVKPARGTLPVRLQVTAAAVGLRPATYSGSIQVTSGGISRAVPVTLVVPAPATVNGTRAGTLVWRGTLEPGGLLTLRGARCSTGKVISGEWEDGLPVIIDQISSSAALLEAPSEANRWTVVIGNRGSAALTSIALSWKAKAQ